MQPASPTRLGQTAHASCAPAALRACRAVVLGALKGPPAQLATNTHESNEAYVFGTSMCTPGLSHVHSHPPVTCHMHDLALSWHWRHKRARMHLCRWLVPRGCDVRPRLVQGYENSPALDEGSLFCDAQRNVLGAVVDVFGPVTEPCYAMHRFAAARAPAAAADGSSPGDPPSTEGVTAAAPGPVSVGMHVYAATGHSVPVDLNAARTTAAPRDYDLEVEGGVDIDEDDEEEGGEGYSEGARGLPGGAGRRADATACAGGSRGRGDGAAAPPRHGRGGRRGCRETDGPVVLNAEVALHALAMGVGGRGRGRGASRGEGRGRGGLQARRRGRGSDAGPPGCDLLRCCHIMLVSVFSVHDCFVCILGFSGPSRACVAYQRLGCSRWRGGKAAAAAAAGQRVAQQRSLPHIGSAPVCACTAT